MRTFPAVAILCFASSATASTRHATPKPAAPTPPPTGAKLAHKKLSKIVDGHATLELVFTSDVRELGDLTVPIEVPEGMTVTNLVLAMPGVRPLVGGAMVAYAARPYYNRIVKEARDPALIEWTEGGLQLSVFPIIVDAPVTITIELTSIADAEGLLRVDHNTSLVVAPDLLTAEDEAYATYWPRHD